MIGSCGFNYWNQIHDRAEISYDLNPLYWRQGIMRKTLKTVLAYAFNSMQINRVEACVLGENSPSITLLKSLGFQYEGCLREQKSIRNHYCDSLLFSLLNREYC